MASPGASGGAGPAPLSLRAFARRKGVDPKAVRKAVASGRLRESLGRTPKGQPCIVDAELADREWMGGASKPNAGQVAQVPDSPPPAGPTSAPPAEDQGLPDSLTEAQLRVAIQREESLRLSNLEKSGKLIDADEARREAFACARTIRDAVFGLRERLAAEFGEGDPVRAARIYARMDEELRKAFEAAAGVLAHGE